LQCQRQTNGRKPRQIVHLRGEGGLTNSGPARLSMPFSRFAANGFGNADWKADIGMDFQIVQTGLIGTVNIAAHFHGARI
jgi:hypothetical protein